ncbi:unnamed protein product [Triticum turgidum subsp. durum]|uniref:Fe2OG dioxygenase domain-containing protein n=1 Tax=Triticum turgidum subsp. durum TaxID=4567 RepID=A0A9R0VH70_TRITD|nr:unnamed protein product [Triticum turgidum subsp. durum]
MAASPSSTLVSPPRVDLDGEDTSTLVRGTPEWLRCAGLVRRALEANGWVAVGCRRRVPPELRERMLVAMAELFALPRETKRRTGAADGPYRAYMEKRDSAACHHEAFGVLNAAAGGGEEARAFVARAWPHGNDRFLETLTSTAGEMARLARVILAMVVDGYGLSHRSDEIVAATDTNFRMLRYHNDNTRTSSSDGQPAVGLAAHVDGSYLTVLFQNDVDGFEMRTGDGGEWARVHSPGPDSLLVVAGQPLVVSWSNGRLHAPVHRVAVGGREDRLSCGVFLLPRRNLVVDAPPELVTVDAPRRFRPFEYSDYLRFKHAGGNGEDVLDRFAGI